MDVLDMIHDLVWDDLPETVRRQARLCVMDLCGIAAGGARTRLSEIVRVHAAAQFGGALPLAFDGRGASPAGYALALGMTADALDGHDGFNPVKGHVGCGLIPAILAVAGDRGGIGGEAFLTTVAMGYEISCRLGITLHATASDYHTSGAWVAVGAAAACARLLGLSRAATDHALGIAEYHGPRSQMMRCIDHPTMLKDGSGWGAMAGVSAAYLARDGFTGAPALTLSGPAWHDLGTRWMILEQYFKPYPVCRWAQAPVEAALSLARAHGLSSGDIAGIRIRTFHEATRLAVKHPRTTEEAQYSTSFPVAVALARGGLAASDLDGPALADAEIARLSEATEMIEDAGANARFPAGRPARVTLALADGRNLQSDWVEPRWTAEAPPTEAELRAKFDALARPALGDARAERLLVAIDGIEAHGTAPLAATLAQPISEETTRGSAA